MHKRLGTGRTHFLLGYPRRPLAVRVPDQAGFTLLELLVVLAIMVIAIAAFPLALDRALPGRRVHAATEHLEAAIRHGEIESIARDQPVRLSVSRLTSQFPASIHVEVTGPGGAPLRALMTYPDGSTNGPHFVVSDGADRGTLTVSEITGRIDVDAR